MSSKPIARPGPRNAITDVPGILVGSAHDESVRSGVTVVSPEKRAVCGAAIGGGGPGTRETDALAAENLVDAVDAIVLSGGSVYGLAAADGVAASLGASGQGFALRPGSGAPVSPIVPAAILYDLGNGGDKSWGSRPPYWDLGADALAAAGPEVRQGLFGAGRGAMAGTEPGGQGSASIETPDGWIVGALAAVNCFGSVRAPGGGFWAWPFEIGAEFGGLPPPSAGLADPEDWGAAKAPPAGLRQNTTLAVVAVNSALTPAQARRLALMAQAGLARAIRPVFAPFDGDVVFALALGAREADPYSLTRLGALAADCLTRAVARAVHSSSL